MRIPGAEEVHLWMLELDRFNDPEILSCCEAVMSDDERERARRFYFEEHRTRFLITRGAIRSLLSQYCSAIEPAQWRFTTNPYGRPYIDAPSEVKDLYFNISHSKNRVVIGISSQPAIGVDVEAVSDKRKITEIARKHFSDNEFENLCDLALCDKPGRFYDLWTLKESYIKACGKGLAIPLGQFSFQFQDVNDIAIMFDPALQDDPAQWQFYLYEVANEYRIALALKSAASKGRLTIETREMVSLSKGNAVELKMARSSEGLSTPSVEGDS